MKKKSSKQLLILLDAHAIIHRAYHAMPDFATIKGVPTGAIYGFAMMVLKIIDEYKPNYIVACYDLPGKTFRHESFKEYKKGRTKTDDALKLQFDATREICEAFSIPIYNAPGFEADDILGTITAQLKDNINVDILIASGDMDTLQLVSGTKVRVYTLKRGINDIVIYDEKAIEDRFGFSPLSIIDYKALRGDPSDNIPGIKGIGEKTATLIISRFGTIENLYASLEKDDSELMETGITERMLTLIKKGREEAEFSKVIATIRIDVPVFFKLPEHSWMNTVDVNHALSIFEKYELRALPKRLRKSLNIDEPEYIKQTENIHKALPEGELFETLLKLWLLDSDKTDAQIEDILEYAKTKDPKKAKAYIDDKLKADIKSQEIFEHIEQPLISVIRDMQDNGILVDQIFFEKLSQSYHANLDRLAGDIYEHAGMEFNIKSPKQLSKVLFEKMQLPTKKIKRSKTGSYSTNISTLEKLHDEHEIIQKIMEYRELDKLLSAYIDVVPSMVGTNGRLHAEFLQNGTVTGRFSSKNPNMQNIPTRTDIGRKIREGFIAEKGSVFLSLDYSQIELRCFALLSGDSTLINIFKEGGDIHQVVASLIGGVPKEEVDRDMRRKAKIVNFGILYGMGINSLKKEMKTDRAEAQKFYDGFFRQFPKGAAYLEHVKKQAQEKGYTTTLFGRRRQFKNINSKLSFIRAMAERMALNAPIQGTSADMIKIAMVQINVWLRDIKKINQAKLILQIHDEIIYEVKKHFLTEFEAKTQEIMQRVLENSYLNYTPPFSLVVHTQSGQHWGELK